VKVLLIGAGAVGLTFGHHLARGGAEVTFFVREKYAAAARAGFDLHRLGLGRRPRHERLDGVGVVTTPEEAGATAWDQVWLCVSSTALAGEWLDDLLGAMPPCTLVALQPGLDDRARLTSLWAEDRLVQGVIMFIAYQSPLPGLEAPLAPGVAFWLPPGSPCPFAGPEPRVREVVQTLKAGGLPAKHDATGPAHAASLSAIMMPNLVALEAESWSLSRFWGSPKRKLAARAAEEALAIVGRETGRSAGAVLRWATSRMLGPGLRIGRRIMPLPLEAYLAYHFTKVSDQTHAMIAVYIQRGEALQLPVASLVELQSLAD